MGQEHEAVTARETVNVIYRDDTASTESITEEYRAISLFTDRTPALRRFMTYLNGDQPPHTILFFHGDGGNGKTLLLRFLREQCCKHFDSRDWTPIKGDPDDDAFKASVVGAAATAIPYAILDFDSSVTTYQPKDAYPALLKLHRDLTTQGLHFPLYDVAVLTYLKKTHQSSEEHIRALFPIEEINFLSELANLAAHAIPHASFFKSLLGLANKYAGPPIHSYLERGKKLDQRLTELGQRKPDDLLRLLPSLFAEDLIAAMAVDQAPPRLVLFFDTHEAFWDQHHDDSDAKFYGRDEWLRQLLLPLVTRPSGVVAVVAGRDKPRWLTAPTAPIPDTRIEAYRIDGLPDAHAHAYLTQAAIAIDDEDLRRSMLEYARFGPNEIHPLHLGLAADIVLAARHQGQQLQAADFADVPEAAAKNEILIIRLLKYVGQEEATGVRAVSVCRAFNRDIYFALADGLHFTATRATWDTLTRFSFVLPTDERGPDWYRIHDLLRRLIRAQDPDFTREADVVMERFYRDRAGAGDEAAIAEAIYHANRLDQQRSVEEWVTTLDTSLKQSRYGLCQALLAVRPHLVIDNTTYWSGRMSMAEGDYYARVSLYGDAQQAYGEAIVAFDADFTLAPDDVYALVNKGNALQSLGEVQASLARHDDALANYAAALAAYDAALALAPNNLSALANKGNALQHQGDVQAKLSHHDDALASYAAALAAYDATITPDVRILNNKGNALQSRGDVQVTLARHDDALASYATALTAYDAALTLDPGNIGALNNKATVLQRQGDVQATLGRHDDALDSFDATVVAYDAALTLAPNDLGVLNNKGTVLQSRGDVQAILGRHDDALASFNDALAAFGDALTLAPNNIEIFINKGTVLQNRGGLQAMLGRHAAALTSFDAAVASFNDALALAPDYVFALANKGNALQGKGNVQAIIASYKSALASFDDALASFNAALTLAPNNLGALTNKGTALQRQGSVQATLGHHAAALTSFNDALASYDAALIIAPNDLGALSNKGNALQRQGEVQATLARHDDALTSFNDALAAHDAALTIALDPRILNNKGSTLQRQGSIHIVSGDTSKACAAWQDALTALSRSLAIVPGDQRIIDQSRELQGQIDKLCQNSSAGD